MPINKTCSTNNNYFTIIIHVTNILKIIIQRFNEIYTIACIEMIKEQIEMNIKRFIISDLFILRND